MTPRAATPARSRTEGPVRVTVLVDDRTASGNLAHEHGLSLWVEAGQSRVLIDTGETEAFLSNAGALGIDVGEARAIALSHGHYDHSGGLPAALRAAPAASLYLHPAALQPRYARRRRGRPLSVGMPAESRDAALAAAGRIVWTGEPAELAPGIWCTGPVPRDQTREPGDPDFFFDSACTMPDPVPDDQSFWIDTPEGLWVILGCAHSGVVATLEYIDVLTGRRPLARLIGGTHLTAATSERIALVAAELERRAPAVLAPCHCTGRLAHARLKRTFRGAVLPVGSGAVVE